MLHESEMAANAQGEQRRLIAPLHYPDDVALDAAEHAVAFIQLEVDWLKFKRREQVASELATIVGAIGDGLPTNSQGQT